MVAYSGTKHKFDCMTYSLYETLAQSRVSHKCWEHGGGEALQNLIGGAWVNTGGEHRGLKTVLQIPLKEFICQ